MLSVASAHMKDETSVVKQANLPTHADCWTQAASCRGSSSFRKGSPVLNFEGPALSKDDTIA